MAPISWSYETEFVTQRYGTGDYYNTNETSDDSLSFWLPIAAIAAGGLVGLVLLICCLRGICRIARNSHCSLLCRTCSRSCKSQCGYANVSERKAILRAYEGTMENDRLFHQTVLDNHIMRAIVCQIGNRCPKLGLDPHLVGSLKERLGKPTRVISEEYPYGLPSRSPLCTDVDVMLVSKTLLTTHNMMNQGRLLIIPSPAHIGFAMVLVPAECFALPRFNFLLSLTQPCTNLENQMPMQFLSAELMKEHIKGALHGLNIGKLSKKSNKKFRYHKRSLSVTATGPAVKVVLRQQIGCCKRCYMLGQCSWRLCCCMVQCLREDELDVSFEGDFTFALKSEEWPPIASEWATRSRAGFWPPPVLVQEIINNGCALVPKSEWGNGSLWRYSFSQAEIKLINSIPRSTLQVLLAIKGLLKRENCELKSYTLKSMMFWCLESSEHPEGFWLDDANLPAKLDYILHFLLSMIKEGRCKNYFIREINLLDAVSNVPSVVSTLERICASPYDYLTTRSLERSRCCALSTLICRLLSGCHDTELTIDIY